MASIITDISDDIQRLQQLKDKIKEIKDELKGINVNVDIGKAQGLGSQLKDTTRQYDELQSKLASAQKEMAEHSARSAAEFQKQQKEIDALIKKYERLQERLKNGGGSTTRSPRTYTDADISSALSTPADSIRAAREQLKVLRAAVAGVTDEQERQTGARSKLNAKIQENTRYLKENSDAYTRQKMNVGNYEHDIKNAIGATDRFTSSLTKLFVSIGGIAAFKQFATQIVAVRGQFQQLEIAFRTMLKSQEKADALMSELIDIAAKTPFDLQGVASAAKQMLAYGSSVEDVGNELVMLGNVAAGVGAPLGDIAYLYGTLRAQGRAYAVDIRQFAGRGIPIYEELAKVLGVTKDEVSSLVTAGKVGFPQVEQAFKNMTSQSGIYYNLMQEQSKSLTGQISNLGDAWDTMLNDIGKNTQGIASGSISALKTLIENYDTIGKILVGLISTYGAYKAALVITTIAQDTLTARMQLALVVTKAQAVAQKVLNAVMKANPYVLLATAVVGVVSAMWAFRDSTTAAEKAQKGFNDARQRFMDQEEQRQQKVNDLIRVIQDQTETDLAQVKAYEELGKLSPALVAAYSREEIAAIQLTEAQRKLNEERDKANYDYAYNQVERYTNQLRTMREVIANGQYAYGLSETMSNQLREEYGYGPTLYEKVEQAEENLKHWQNLLNEYINFKIKAAKEAEPVEVRLITAKEDLKDIDKQFEEAKKRLEEWEARQKESPFLITIPIAVKMEYERLRSLRQEQLSEISTLEGAAAETGETYKEAYAAARQEWEAKKKALEDAKNGTKADYEKARKELDEAEKAYKALGGSTSQPKNTKREEDARLKARSKLDKLLVSMQRKAQDDEIALMQDGTEKKLAEIRRDYDRQADEIKEQQKKLAALNKEAGVTEVNAAGLTTEQQEAVDEALANAAKTRGRGEAKTLEEQFKADKEAMGAYLQEYGTFEEKRLAITEEYEGKIKKAIADGNIGKAFSLSRERSGKLSSLDSGNALQGLEQVFGNLAHLSGEALDDLIARMEEYKRAAIDTFDVSNLKDYEEALDRLYEAKADDRFGIFANLVPEAYKERIKWQEEANRLEQDALELESKKQDLLDKTAAKEREILDLIKQQTGQDFSAGDIYTAEGNRAIKSAYASAGQDSSSAEGMIADAIKLKDSFGAVSTAAEGAKAKAADFLKNGFGGGGASAISTIDAIVHGIDGIVQGLSGAIDDIKGTMDALGADTGADTGIGKLSAGMAMFAEASAGATQAWDSLKSGDIAGVIQGVVQSFTAWIRGFAKLKDAQHEEAIQDIQDQIDDLGDAYDDLGRKADKSYSTVKASNLKLQNENLRRQQQLIRQQMAEEEAKKDTDDEQMDEYRSQLKDIENQIEDNLEAIQEAVTGLSFDSLRDSFISAVDDMGDAAANFTDDIEGMLRNAVLNQLFTDLYEDRLKQLYDSWSGYFDDGSFSSGEVDAMRRGLQGLFGDWYETVDGIDDAFGFGKDAAREQRGTVGVAESMTQESADELNGRFAALQTMVAGISGNGEAQTLALANIQTLATGMAQTTLRLSNVADESLRTLKESYMELTQINDNTERIYKAVAEMRTDIAAVRSNTANL